VNAIFWECGATLQASQTIKQNLFRSSELFGLFTITVTASHSVTLVVFENGISVFSQTGTSLIFSGAATQNEPMYVTIANSQTSATTSYQLSVDWTGV